MNARLEAFDAALSAWLLRQAAAEERLTSFAFREGQPDVAIAPATSHAELRGWLLGIVEDPVVATMLGDLGDTGRPMSELASVGALGVRQGDRVALAARIGALAASGLVARELETDRVMCTALGQAAFELVPPGPAGAAAARSPAGAGAARSSAGAAAASATVGEQA